MQDTVMDVINLIGNEDHKMLEILMEIQDRSEYNYLTPEDIKDVSVALDISETKVFGIANFYAMLSTKKRGRHVIEVCNSTPCYILNSDSIVEILEGILGVKVGEVTEDQLFSLEYTSCLGACDASPAIKIDHKTYGHLDRGKIFNLLASIRREENI
jgi:NADH-quinone oxidoreductase subunit E